MRLLFVISTLSSLYLLSTHALADHTDSTGLEERLKALLDEMKNEIDGLKKKVSSLEMELSEVKAASKADRKRQLTSSITEVAFSASVGSHLTNLATDQAIVFSSVTTNIGNRYNPSTGIFHVNEPGTYLIYANILSEPNESIETELVVDGTSVMEIYSGGALNSEGPGSNLVILELKPGQDVWVKVHGHFSSNMGVHCCWSTFSGYLLHRADEEGTFVG